MKFNISILFIFLTSSCFFEKDEYVLEKDIASTSKVSQAAKAKVYNVTIQNDQLVIDGADLVGVSQVTIQGTSFNEVFSIESKSTNQIIANGLRAFSFGIGKVFSLILSDAHGAATYQVSFTLDDKSVTAAKLHDMGAGDGDVLVYDQPNDKWEPRPLSGLNMVGTWNANTNSPSLANGGANTSPLKGDYYVVGTAGATNIDGESSWSPGDWIIYSGTNWDRVSNTSDVTDFNGRQGAIVPTAGDYDLDMLGDVDTTGVAVGKVLKWDGTKWAIADDLSGGGAGSVTTTEIQNATIVDADISGSAGIAQSKINNLTSDLSTINTNVSTNSSGIATNATAISGKEDTIAAGTTAQFFRGDKTWQALNKAVVGLSNVDDIQQMPLAYLDTDNTLTADSDTKVPSQRAIKAYVDTAIAGVSSGDFMADGSVAMTGDLDVGTNQIKNLADPTLAQDAATKNYVDTAISSSAGFVQNGNSYGVLATLGTNDSQPLGLETNNLERMRIAANGNIGIGTTSPNSKLEVAGDISSGSNTSFTTGTGFKVNHHGVNPWFTGFYGYKSRAGAVVASGDQVMQIEGNGHDGTSYQKAASIIFSADAVPSTGIVPGRIKFFTSDISGTLQSRMEIDKDGNIGVGTSSPTQKLDVLGNIKATQFIGDGSNLTGITSTNSSNDVNAVINADADSNTSGEVQLQTGGTTKMVVTNSGNVGIGATSPVTALQVEGSVSSYGDQTDILSVFKSNGAHTAVAIDADASKSTAMKFMEAGAAKWSLIRSQSDDSFNFYNYASGQSHMVITADGLVGIGDVTPTRKLSVVDQRVDETDIDSTGFISNVENDITVDGTYGTRAGYFINKTKVGSGVTAAGNQVGFLSQVLRNLGTTGDDGILSSQVSANIGYGHYNSDAAATPQTTSAYGIKVYPYSRTGTITNAYDLYIGSPNGGTGTITNHYSLYQNHAASTNYLAGDLGIGTNNPSEKLEVMGNVKATSFLGDGSSLTNVNAQSSSNNTDAVINADADGNTSGNILFQTAGATKAVITNDGKLGLGLTSPEAMMQMPGTESFMIGLTTDSYFTSLTSNQLQFNRASGPSYIRQAGLGGTIRFQTSVASKHDTEAMLIDSNGNVGIGTLTPTTRFHVLDPAHGAVVKAESSSASGYAGFAAKNATQAYTMQVRPDESNGLVWRDETSAVNRMTLTSTGNLGVGTTTPSHKVEVTGSGTGVLLNLYRKESGSNYGSGFSLSLNNGAGTKTDYARVFAGVEDNSTGAEKGFLSFNVADGSGTWAASYAQEVMRILSNGNTGIGTSTPSEKLDVNGNIRLTNGADRALIGPNNEDLNIVTNPNEAGEGIKFFTDGGVTPDVVIADGGLVGVGIATPTKKIEALGTIMATDSSGYTNSLQLRPSQLIHYGPTPLKIGTSTIESQPILFETYDGTSYAERMVVDSAGNVGIGTTAPSTKLDVSDGNIKVRNIGDSVAKGLIFSENDSAPHGFSLKYDGRLTGIDNKLSFFVGNGAMDADEILTMKRSGKIGMGTTAPDAKLTVDSKADTLISRFHSTTNADITKGVRINAANSGGTQTYLDLVVDPTNTKVGLGIGTSGTNLPIGKTDLAQAELVIDSTGKVGIGTASPSASLEVVGDIIVNNTVSTNQIGKLKIKYAGSSNPYLESAGTLIETRSPISFYVNGKELESRYPGPFNVSHSRADSDIVFQTSPTSDNNQTTRMVILGATGNVGIGNSAPSEKLHVTGNLRVQGTTDCTLGNGAGATNCTSDQRLKDNVFAIPYALDKINQIRGVEFDWNEDSLSPGKHSIGVIAQEIQKVFPTAVVENADGYLSVDYAVLVSPLIEATKELSKNLEMFKLMHAGIEEQVNENTRRIASLEQENQEIKAQNQELHNEVQALRSVVCELKPDASICK
ncbi:MAG: tail fiber domain-containing protein [Bacteriovoracaceae bacterium]|nr:tail fiber domain-containing protein [Bacteriovoracaceae bacterium]